MTAGLYFRPRLSPFEGAWADAVESLMARRGKQSHPIIESRATRTCCAASAPTRSNPTEGLRS